MVSNAFAISVPVDVCRRFVSFLRLFWGLPHILLNGVVHWCRKRGQFDNPLHCFFGRSLESSQVSASLPLVDLRQDVLNGFELFAQLHDRLNAVSGVLWRVAHADQGLVGFRHQV